MDYGIRLLYNNLMVVRAFTRVIICQINIEYRASKPGFGQSRMENILQVMSLGNSVFVVSGDK